MPCDVIRWVAVSAKEVIEKYEGTVFLKKSLILKDSDTNKFCKVGVGDSESQKAEWQTGENADECLIRRTCQFASLKQAPTKLK